MRVGGAWFLWLLSLFCLAFCLAQGLFTVSGFMGLVIGVLALPIPPVRLLWKKILPPGAPRIAKATVLLAAFVVMIAAAVSELSDKEVFVVPKDSETSAQDSSPAAAAQEEVPAGAELPSAREEQAEEPASSDAETAEALELPSKESVVYIAGSGSGTKYHKDPDCSGMQGAVPLTRKEAERQGYAPCKRCYG